MIHFQNNCWKTWKKEILASNVYKSCLNSSTKQTRAKFVNSITDTISKMMMRKIVSGFYVLAQRKCANIKLNFKLQHLLTELSISISQKKCLRNIANFQPISLNEFD